MPLSSGWFLIFCVVTWLLSFATAGAARIALLIAAGAVFHWASTPGYLTVLFSLAVAGYAGGLAIDRSNGAQRKAALAAVVLFNLAFLFAFKYVDFAMSSFADVAAWAGVPFQWAPRAWALPLGLSFLTFQGIAYAAEVYAGDHKAERNPLHFGLFVAFWPLMTAGPIARPSLIDRFKRWRRPDGDHITSGLRLMAWGMFKKLAVADRIGRIVDGVYDAPEGRAGIQVVIAAALYLMQLYCDFSGYCDAGRGAARVMGIDLPANFRAPFNSISIREFWRRWNVSLSEWLRDFVYYPASKGGRTVAAMIFGTLLVFFVSGVWHGAAWTFIAWGMLNGLYCCIELLVERRTPRVSGWLRPARQILIYSMVTATMILFRAPTWSGAMTMFGRLGADWQLASLAGHIGAMDLTPARILLLAGIGAIVLTVEGDHSGPWLRNFLRAWPTLRWACYQGLVATILVSMDTQRMFIYGTF